jgi:hypothetical protein
MVMPNSNKASFGPKYLAAAAACAFLALAAAQAAPVQNNLRFYIMMDEDVDLTIDTGAKMHLAPNMKYSLAVDPGAHTFHVATPSGLQAAFDLSFEPETMSDNLGRKWWCVLLGKNDQGLGIRMIRPETCKKLLDLSPPEN